MLDDTPQFMLEELTCKHNVLVFVLLQAEKKNSDVWRQGP